MRLRNIMPVLPVLMTMCGCSTIINSHTQKEPMMRSYMAGNLPAVTEFIHKKIDSTSKSGDELMWLLEAGGIDFNQGRYTESLNYFRRAEAVIKEYDERAIVSMRDTGSEAVMALTNLNALPYRGFCRDRIMLAVYKSLAYLGESGEDSFRAQVRRLRDEQKKVVDDYRKFFDAEQKAVKDAAKKDSNIAAAASSNNAKITGDAQNAEFKASLEQTRQIANRGFRDFLNPAALFLSGLSSIRDGAYDNGIIEFQRLYEAMPNNALMRRYYSTALRLDGREIPEFLKNEKPFDFQLDANCVYVLHANGRGAAFREVSVYIPVMTAWPVCEYYPAPYPPLKVTAGGRIYGAGMLADMDGIISREYDERLPAMITRIVISTAIKETAYYGGAIALSEHDSLAGLLYIIFGTIYRMTFNTADTRSWETLPKEFRLTQFPMPPDRKVTIAAGARTLNVEIPPQHASAILYVWTPNANIFTCNILGFKSK